MSRIKEWLLDRQLNGDDGTGVNDYVNTCDDCDSEITLTLEAYGNGQLMRIECPNCGVSYDTNLDPVEEESEGK